MLTSWWQQVFPFAEDLISHLAAGGSRSHSPWHLEERVSFHLSPPPGLSTLVK